MINRSNKNVSALIFDTLNNKTLATYSSNNSKDSKNQKSVDIGKKVAEFLKKHKITSAVFDRNNYRYHGRVAAIADSIRENGVTI